MRQTVWSPLSRRILGVIWASSVFGGLVVYFSPVVNMVDGSGSSTDDFMLYDSFGHLGVPV